MNHVNIENDEVTVPYYAIHKDDMIFGFFGAFRFLSNFYILENGVWFEELTYPSVEHAFQAAKWPVDMRAQFMGVESWRAKKLGKLAPHFNKKKWDKKKVGVMSGFVRQKFEKNPRLRAMLLMTEGCKLEERNNWGDIFWGTDEQGNGENQLGKILMDVRRDLKIVEKGEAF